jgi:peptidoglycan/LPS O-acetylase OafA/YrhL
MRMKNALRQTISYRPDIDGLRALAVISVVLFHAFPKLFPGGFIGVDIFFVISGYLLMLVVLTDWCICPNYHGAVYAIPTICTKWATASP